MSSIKGNGGSLDWGGYNIGVKAWAIQLDQPEARPYRWYGKMTISIADFQAMHKELLRLGSGSIKCDVMFRDPISAILRRNGEEYKGNILIDLDLGLSFATTDKVIQFKGTGPLTPLPRT